MTLFAVRTFVTVFVTFFVVCKPQELQDIVPSTKAFDFMKQYGYIESGHGSEAIYTKEAISEAVKNVQRFGALPETGILDNATLQLMSSPRCGVPDVLRKDSGRMKRYAIASDGWTKRHITYFISHTPSFLNKEAVARNIQLALNAWGKFSGLSFTRVNNPLADIVVLFARGAHDDSYDFDGRGNVLAHAFFPGDGLGGDAHFDEDEPWSTEEDESGESIDFFSVAVHELGHSLGLAHSDVETSVMFPYYRNKMDKENFSLDYDDIKAMYELYYQRANFADDYTSTSYPRYTTRSYYEPSTEYPPRRPFRPNEEPNEIPNICEGHFDAVAMLRTELFIFKGKYLWRLRDKQQILPGYPAPFRQMFPELPENIDRIDAAYEKPDGTIVLFTGNIYWNFDGTRFVDSPRPLSDYGLPSSLDKIDAVQNWRANGKTYFYRKNKFWRYNESTKRMDKGYPRGMEKWRGVPRDLDAALTWKDGLTYFFKHKLYWTFDNNWIIVTDSSPLPAPEAWLGCPEDEEVMNYLSRNLH